MAGWERTAKVPGNITVRKMRFRLVSVPMVRHVQHSGHYMYRQFNIQQLYVLPTQCIYVFCVDLRTDSDYFLYTALTDIFITETECV